MKQKRAVEYTDTSLGRFLHRKMLNKGVTKIYDDNKDEIPILLETYRKKIGRMSNSKGYDLLDDANLLRIILHDLGLTFEELFEEYRNFLDDKAVKINFKPEIDIEVRLESIEKELKHIRSLMEQKTKTKVPRMARLYYFRTFVFEMKKVHSPFKSEEDVEESLSVGSSDIAGRVRYIFNTYLPYFRCDQIIRDYCDSVVSEQRHFEKDELLYRFFVLYLALSGLIGLVQSKTLVFQEKDTKVLNNCFTDGRRNIKNIITLRNDASMYSVSSQLEDKVSSVLIRALNLLNSILTENLEIELDKKKIDLELMRFRLTLKNVRVTPIIKLQTKKLDENTLRDILSLSNDIVTLRDNLLGGG